MKGSKFLNYWEDESIRDADIFGRSWDLPKGRKVLGGLSGVDAQDILENILDQENDIPPGLVC